MKCPNCGGEVGNYNTCQFCGTLITPEMMKQQIELEKLEMERQVKKNRKGCPNCGSANIVVERETLEKIKEGNNEKTIKRTMARCQDCGHTWTNDDPYKDDFKRAIIGISIGFAVLIVLMIAVSIISYNGTKHEREEERLAAERELEEKRLENERELEEKRIAAERELEEKRLEAKRLEEERLAAEREAEEKRLAAEREAEEKRLEEERKLNELEVPFDSSEVKKKLYEEVKTGFEQKGYQDIQVKPIYDLIIGWSIKDGQVEYVMINGDSDFSKDQTYPKDATVAIGYHTFESSKPKEEELEEEKKLTGEEAELTSEEAVKNAMQTVTLEEKLDPYKCWDKVENYGKQYYDDFTLHYVLDKIAQEPADDDAWYLKAGCTYKDGEGNDVKSVCEAIVSGTTEDIVIENFNVSEN